MRTTFTTALLLTAALLCDGLSAQNAAPEQARPANAPPPRLINVEPHQSTGNVQVELSIADYLGSAAPQKKTVSMLVAEGYMGRVRSNRGNAAMLNVDATPRMQKDGRISLQLTVEYRPRETAETLDSMSPITESITVLLQSGKPLVVTQAADPSSDRRVTVEVTATVLK
jgi:hypothetical protein